MEALDHLGARCTEAECETPAREGVQPGGGLGNARRGAAVGVKDATCQLNGVGAGGEEAQKTHPVEAVGLGYPDAVHAGRLQFSSLFGCSEWIGGVVEEGCDAHGRIIAGPRGSVGVREPDDEDDADRCHDRRACDHRE